jgi:hypothetical protein
LAVIAAATSSAAIAGPKLQTFQIGVSVRSGATTSQYRTTALVVSFPPAYRAEIAYVGGKRGLAVMNGGFYAKGEKSDTGDPASPAGLLLVNGRIISPMSFGQSAILCVDGAGKMKILRTADIRSVAKSIASLCADAVQSFPIVVRKGGNDVNPAELGRRAYARTILGFRRDGSPVAVFFRSPVHLYVAAEFLRAAPSRATSVQISGDAGKGVRVTGGLGLVDAVNLSGDTDSFAALNGRVLLGDAYRELPSAIVIR